MDDLSYVFDAEMGKSIEWQWDSVVVKCKGLCDRGGSGDSVNNSGGWYEITGNEVGQCEW